MWSASDGLVFDPVSLLANLLSPVDLRSKALSIECADTRNAARNLHTCANAEVASPDLVITALVRMFHRAFGSGRSHVPMLTNMWCCLLQELSVQTPFGP